MKLSDFPEVVRLVPAKSEQQEMYYVGWNKAIDSLTPLLELEVGIDIIKLAKLLHEQSRHPEWVFLSIESKQKWVDKANSIASSNVIEIRKV